MSDSDLFRAFGLRISDLLFGLDFRVTRSGRLNVWGNHGIDVPGRPAYPTKDKILEERVGPDILAVSHPCVEDAALAFRTGPGTRRRRV